MPRLSARRAISWQVPHPKPCMSLKQSTADLCCASVAQPQSQKAHSHAGSDKVYLVAEGSGRFRVGEAERTLEAGEAVMAPSEAPHGIENDSPS